MTTISPQRWTGFRLWFWWAIASIVGTFVGFVLAVVVIVATGKDDPDDPYFLIVFPVIIAGVGAVLASCQLLVLRRAVGRVRGWVAASAIGSGVAIAVALALPEGSGLVGVVVEGALHGVAVGIIIGTAQWLALRHNLAYARWWVPVSILAWMVGAATGDFVGYYADGPLDLMTGFAVACLVNGAGLVALLRRVTPAASADVSINEASLGGRA
jgi:hypothetical protein